MRYFLYLLLSIGSVFAFYSCSTESDASDVQVMVTPDSLLFHSESQDIIPFQIALKALKEPLARFQITQRTTKTGLVTLLDTALNVQKFNYEYQYTVPQNIYERSIELSFIANTASDYSVSAKQILLDSLNTPLKESSAHVMYGSSFKTNNSFSIIQRQVVSFPHDSILSDIYDYHNDQIDASELSGEWRSATLKRFSRFNDFNYAEATVQSLQTCYANASKKTMISDLKVNDVIIIGDLNNAIAVIKIIAIFDEEGYKNDRYVFNVKYI
jgi:hypothetical protein